MLGGGEFKFPQPAKMPGVKGFIVRLKDKKTPLASKEMAKRITKPLSSLC